jgi:purine-binding chemotaxis protein CheW
MPQQGQVAQQYVLFIGGGTRFATPISQVLRITPRLPMTRVPRAPAFLEGVVNDQGQVVPVVDLRKRMGLPYDGADPEHEKIVVLELAEQMVGLLVDDVLDLIAIEPAQIQPPPQMVAQVNGVYLTGVVRLEEELVLLLDLDHILTLAEVEDVRQLDGEP